MNYKILAIDPSLRGTGYCYSSSEYGVLHFSKNTDICEDLSKISDFIENLIIKENITHVFREGYALAYRNSGMTRIMEVGGVLKRLFYKYNIQYIDIPPLTVKKIITGAGKGKKEGVMNIINTELDLNISDDNITDAIAIYSIGYVYMDYIQKHNIPFGTKISELSDPIRSEIYELWKLWKIINN